MNDPYQILGVRKDASADDVKQAWRRLVKEVHPDLHPGDPAMEKRFKQVAAAYGLLGDPDKRSRFDRGLIDADGRPLTRTWRAWRNTPPPHEKAPSPGPGNSGASGAGRDGESSARTNPFRNPGADHRTDSPEKKGFFRDFFRNGPKLAGKDVEYDLTVPFVVAAAGGREKLTLSDGRTVTVTIPGGAVTDQTLRLKGQGLKGMGGGAPGDALVCLTVAPHSHFRREDMDIHLRLPISLKEAILGAIVDTPTIHGRVALKIPPGSSSGRVLRLRKKGIEGPGKAGGDRVVRGDQLVTLELVMPETPDPALRALIEGWNPPAGYNPRRDAGF